MIVVDFLLNIDQYLETIMSQYTVLTYLVLFGIIFVETGVVILPFLPGDSVLFAAGAIIAKVGILNPIITLFILYAAAILGDSLNYSIGRHFGTKLKEKQNLKFLKMEYIEKTQQFFEKHGHQAITIARFVPIIRTMAPFVAGMSEMKYQQFIKYNVIGGILWISIFFGTGYFFGNIPFLKEHFSLIVLGVVVISFLPVLFTFVNQIKVKKTSSRKK